MQSTLNFSLYFTLNMFPLQTLVVSAVVENSHHLLLKPYKPQIHSMSRMHSSSVLKQLEHMVPLSFKRLNKGGAPRNL
jgi:hypothetical protein